MDKRRQICLKLDKVVMQTFCFESGEALAVCSGLWREPSLRDNLGNFLRRLALPRKIKHWSLRSLLTRFIKIGAKVVRHSRYVTFQMAEVTINKKIFTEILFQIDQLQYLTV